MVGLEARYEGGEGWPDVWDFVSGSMVSGNETKWMEVSWHCFWLA